MLKVRKTQRCPTLWTHSSLCQSKNVINCYVSCSIPENSKKPQRKSMYIQGRSFRNGPSYFDKLLRFFNNLSSRKHLYNSANFTMLIKRFLEDKLLDLLTQGRYHLQRFLNFNQFVTLIALLCKFKYLRYQ